MAQFYGIIKPVRQDFLTNPDKEETKLMSQHFLYLKNLLLEGKLIMAGPTLVETDPFGVYILETETEEEARELMTNDPAVKAGIQRVVDFRPIRVSLIRGMELK